MPVSVITNTSANSVPMMRSVLIPVPPLTWTGALMMYWIRFESVPPLTFVSVEPSAANARTVNTSSPASPLRVRTAVLWNTVKSSASSPPLIVVGRLTPLLR